jgi:hypothetical protein
MYYIRKYADCWAIHDDDTGASRPLAAEEANAVQKEFPTLTDPKVRTVFTDTVITINPNLPY